ncbi:uncharacterized protein B0H18DRAFT_1210780 [Fomitopsis serialis]|uniref:uncharacterized protein n=1 Tax=Fomitopsis serialis TaxID=139415 RepID=UPI002008D101|nr:uncharacterized protein B0H18DRAFT_1210780 [Neoantrodia serialis]KAH9926859.1 hypothetical protein B0H18DRAFT_1210780 [Neoantrodia serialis]
MFSSASTSLSSQTAEPVYEHATAGERESSSVLGKRKATDDHAPEHLNRSRTDPTISDSDACEDYQLCDDLWDALAAALQNFYGGSKQSATRPQYVNFRGTYAIVADPKTTLWKRVELVSKDLRRLGSLPHSEMTESARQHRVGCWTETYQCDCSRERKARLPPPPPAPSLSAPSPFSIPTATPPTQASQMFKFTLNTPPATQPPTPSAKPVKRTQSTLANWLSKASKTKPVPTATDMQTGDKPSECGGRLHITVGEVEHPLGYFKGQRIVVVLEHPRGL